MSLQIPSYQTAYSTTPTTNAIAWILSLSVDFGSGTGRVLVAVNPDAASAEANLPPIATVPIALGQTLAPGSPDADPPVPPTTFYTLTELVTAAAEAQATTPSLTPFDAIRQALYAGLKQHPLFADATDV